VVRDLNRYLDAVTAAKDNDEITELRGQAVKAMRSDLQRSLKGKTRLGLPELYRIEIKPPQPTNGKKDGVPSDTKAKAETQPQS
jgi:hypothetical protein